MITVDLLAPGPRGGGSRPGTSTVRSPDTAALQPGWGRRTTAGRSHGATVPYCTVSSDGTHAPRPVTRRAAADRRPEGCDRTVSLPRPDSARHTATVYYNVRCSHGHDPRLTSEYHRRSRRQAFVSGPARWPGRASPGVTDELYD
eukprot:766721-Hanusia_phi.AAC.1